MQNLEETLEKIYSLGIWVENLETPEGEKRFRRALERFRRIVEHEWIRELIEKKQNITLIDICEEQE